MDLLKKLEELSIRFKTVTEEISNPDLIKDQKKYKDTMRENQYLSDLMTLYDEYKKSLTGIEEAKLLITSEDDADMKEMAREELKTLEEAIPQLEE